MTRSVERFHLADVIINVTQGHWNYRWLTDYTWLPIKFPL